MDTKQMEVEQIFRVSTADELQKVANAWELPEGDWKDKQSREVLRKLQDKLDEDMIDEETKEKLYLKTVPCLSCLLYTSPSPRDLSTSRMPSSA